MKIPQAATIQHAYNSYGNVTVTTDTEGRATTYTYDTGRPHLLKTVTSLGTTTTHDYDSRDRLTTTSDHIGNKTVYGYDARDRQTTVTDAMGNVTQYVYDTTGSLWKIIDPDNYVQEFEYDVEDRLTTFTNQRGKKTVYEYDIEGRKISETNPIGKKTRYYYADDAGCTGCGAGVGGSSSHLRAMTDPADRTTTYSYDIMDRLTTVTHSGVGDVIVYTYDAAGRQTAVKDTRLPSSDIGGDTFAPQYIDCYEKACANRSTDAGTGFCAELCLCLHPPVLGPPRFLTPKSPRVPVPPVPKGPWPTNVPYPKQ